MLANQTTSQARKCAILCRGEMYLETYEGHLISQSMCTTQGRYRKCTVGGGWIHGI